MPMTNQDTVQKKTAELAKNIVAAVKDGDENKVAQAFADFQGAMAEQNSDDLALAMQQMDNQVLLARGARQLTTKEKEFAQMLIDSGDPRQSIADINKAYPESIIDTVVSELKNEHRLLAIIDFVNTKTITKWIYTDSAIDRATWGELGGSITKEISAVIKSLDITLNKLAAFVPVPKDMIDFGPAWVVTLVIEMLKESIAAGLEQAIIDGDGKNKPAGMTRDISSFDSTNGYSRKSAVPLKKIVPSTYNAIVAMVAVKPNGKSRKIPKVIFVCNPVDYLTKVLPATTVRAADGTYNKEIFPFPTETIQSEEIEQGKAVIGVPTQYFVGIGTSKDGKIEYSDDYQFIEDNRVYKIKLNANGKPKDNMSFVYVDISQLEPANLEISVVNSASAPIPTNEVDATLKSLKISNKTLTPTFDAGAKTYTLSTTDATNTITAVANSSTATIVINNGDTTVSNGSAATWTDGENTVTITVTDGNDVETYTVTVTKS